MENPFLERRVLSFAHQGGAKEAPTSTMYAIERAIGLGVNAIELDLHASVDGALIVCHDPTVDRTSNGTGEIVDLQLAQLRQLDNAYNFVPERGAVVGLDPANYPLRGRAPEDASFGFVTLEEVLTSFPETMLNIDIKRTSPVVAPYEALLAKTLRSYKRSDDVIVASFNDDSIGRFSIEAPEIATAAGRQGTKRFVVSLYARTKLADSVRAHVALQVPASLRRVPLVTARFVDHADENGLAVHVWTIDEASEIKRLVGLGVDGIMSDRPELLLKVLDGLDASWRGTPKDK